MCRNERKRVMCLIERLRAEGVSMSVLACTRNGCGNVMCDRYSSLFGYICNECFEELVISEISIYTFLAQYKGGVSRHIVDERRKTLEEEFRLTAQPFKDKE